MNCVAPRTPALLLPALLVAACDVPTEAPILESRWVVPGDETTVQVAELLPDGVTEAAETDAFAAEVAPSTVDRTLGELCPRCRTADGLTVPKPEFDAGFRGRTELPADVVRAEMTGAEVTFTVQNGFSFDPIRPGAGNTGSVRIELVTAASADAEGTVVGALTLDGSDEALPAGGSVSRTVSLDPATLEPFVLADVEVVSPEGDPVEIDAGEELTVTATVEELLVTEAEVEVADLEIEGEPVELGVGDVDPTLVERIQGGDFVLRAANPWSVEAAMTLRVRGSGFSTISKDVTIPGGSTTLRVGFTGAELRSFLGTDDVTLETDGVADATGGPVTVEPGQELRVESDLDLTLRIGG